jgi:hypothetical protein
VRAEALFVQDVTGGMLLTRAAALETVHMALWESGRVVTGGPQLRWLQVEPGYDKHQAMEMLMSR